MSTLTTDPYAGPPGPGSISPLSTELAVTRLQQLARTALMLVPGALVVLMGFKQGGYFPDGPALGAVLLVEVMLIVAITSHRPFDGLSPAALVVIAALGAYGLLQLSSALWSGSVGRSLLEFDRTWFYLLVLAAPASVRATGADLRWLVRGLGIGISVVCLAGLITRLLPNVWPTAAESSGGRLSYPVTYWNALGVLASLGIVLTFHLACGTEEDPRSRAIAAALTPLLALTLFFTFSRGAIAAVIVGLVVYVVVGRPRSLLTGVVCTLPCVELLILLAYRSRLLDGAQPAAPGAVAQGRLLALLALAGSICCATALLAIARGERRRADAVRRRPWRAAARPTGVLLAALAAVAVVGLLVKLPGSPAGPPAKLNGPPAKLIGSPAKLTGPPSRWTRPHAAFDAPVRAANDLRGRLASTSSDERTEYWRVALEAFAAAPIEGHGAGTYQTLWERARARPAHVVDAHSLYLQAMAELGLPGLVLLLVVVGTVLLGLLARARSSMRTTYGALLAFAVVWALHAGIDWDWEMPVVTLGFFASAGAALSRPGRSAPGARRRLTVRVGLVVVLLASAVAPILILGSQSRLVAAENALYRAHDCTSASSAAQSSIEWLGVRPEPYEILGFCDLQRGLPTAGVAAMRDAVRADPGSWETHDALAIAQAAAGSDPRPATRAALQMNPLEPLAQHLLARFNSSDPAEWVTRSAGARAEALASRDLDITP